MPIIVHVECTDIHYNLLSYVDSWPDSKKIKILFILNYSIKTLTLKFKSLKSQIAKPITLTISIQNLYLQFVIAS